MKVSEGDSLAVIPGCRVLEDPVRQTVMDSLFGCLRSHHRRFPGSQPKSFSSMSLTHIRTEDYWVCEKTDGLRVVVFIGNSSESQGKRGVWLMDRKQELYSLEPMECASCVPSTDRLQGTVIDGELLWSVNSDTGKLEPVLHAFDCLAFEGASLAEAPFAERYHKLGQGVIDALGQTCIHYQRASEVISSGQSLESRAASRPRPERWSHLHRDRQTTLQRTEPRHQVETAWQHLDRSSRQIPTTC